jgi:hypothetical protein
MGPNLGIDLGWECGIFFVVFWAQEGENSKVFPALNLGLPLLIFKRERKKERKKERKIY